MSDPNKAIQKLQLEVKQITRTRSILNENQIQKLFNSTPKRYQYTRPGRGGGQWRFVRSGYVRRTLDSIAGFDWSFDLAPESKDIVKILDVAAKTGSITVFGTLVIIIRDERGNEVTRLVKGDAGAAEVKFMKGTKDPLNFGNDIKAATTDCFKRCAARFGVAADVYDPTEFIEIEIIGSEDNSDRKKNVRKQIQNAKRVVRTAAKKVGEQNESSKSKEAR